MTHTRPCIHESKYGTYHPCPTDDVAWTINDTSGYIDEDPICDECGASGSIMYVCLDGGDTLCSECFEHEFGDDCVVPCDCE